MQSISLQNPTDKLSSEKLLNITNSLKNINSTLAHEAQIKLIFFLYSKYSEKCNTLIKTFPNECKQYFYDLCIDNKVIRNMILKSDRVKITNVPCIIIIDIKDTVTIHDGINVIEIIKKIYNIHHKIELSKHPQNCNCDFHRPKNKDEQLTSISSLVQEDSEYPSESKRLPKKVSFPDRMPAPEDFRSDPIDKMGTPIEDIDASERLGLRKKIRNAARPSESFIEPIEPPDVGISSIRYKPKKGIGHEGLARSSLGEIPNKRVKENINVAGGEMLDDLDDMFDSNIDPQITSTNSKGQIDRKVHMDNVKRAASEMAKAREDTEEDI